jgi:hypothetical protein
MNKPFDVSPKSISEVFPTDWPDLLEWGDARVEVIDADVATVSGAVDKVFRIGGAKPWLGALEFMSTYKSFVAERLHWHATLIAHRHQLLVRSVVVLLRPEADGSTLTGHYQESFPSEEPHVIFRYRVLRLWEIPAERLLKGGLGLALFAPLGKVEPNRLVEVVRKVRQRVDKERAKDAPDLVAAMYILMGLRYDVAIIHSIKKEVSEMEESITYQEIIKKGEARGEARGKAEGRVEEAREFLVLMGTERLGPPDAASRRKLRAIDDLSRLHQLGLLTDKVGSWKELLAAK